MVERSVQLEYTSWDPLPGGLQYIQENLSVTSLMHAYE